MDDDVQTWAKWRVYVLLQTIADDLRHRAEGRQASAVVMLAAASRLDIGR